MGVLHLLLGLYLGVQGAFAQSGYTFNDDVDLSFREILQTSTGSKICSHILGADPAALEFHLGISHDSSLAIAAQCKSQASSDWYFPTSPNDIRKLTLKTFKPRKYEILNAELDFPIESWTDPFSNTTVLILGSEDLSHQRIVQLLAHEMAVYFDSKSNPAHPDAGNIPALRDLSLINGGRLNPLVSITDPLIAHTMTFVRALQVEFSILDELVKAGKIQPTEDLYDPYLREIVSAQCQEACLQKLILNMRDRFLPIGLPLLAFAPHYRGLLATELSRVKVGWSMAQYARMQSALNSLPVEFLKRQFSGNPLADLQNVFVSNWRAQPNFQTVSLFLKEDLWPLEWDAITHSHLASGETLLEFMKRPLLSGYNILLSSGPRVRIGTGNTE